MALGGHLQVAVLLHGLDDQALGSVTGDHGRAGVAALEDRGARVEAQAAHLFRGVALVAVLREDGADLVIEELDPVWSGNAGCRFRDLSRVHVEGAGSGERGQDKAAECDDSE